MTTQRFATHSNADGWRSKRFDAALASLFGVVATPQNPQTCSIQMRYGRTPAVLVSEFQADPLEVERDPHAHARPQGELLAILLQEGHMSVAQGRNSVTLEPGDIAIVDQDCPFQLAALDRVRQLAVLLPPTFGCVPNRPGLRGVSRRQRMSRVCHEFTSLLLDFDRAAVDGGTTGAGEETTAAFLAVWRAVLSDPDNLHLLRSGYQATDWSRLAAIMARRYGEETLSPRDVAAELGVSLRTLHNSFSREGVTFRLYLRRLRLEAAATRLAAPAYAHRSITDIGMDVGFRSSSAFSTAFRDSTGVPPRKWRARLGGS